MEGRKIEILCTLKQVFKMGVDIKLIGETLLQEMEVAYNNKDTTQEQFDILLKKARFLQQMGTVKKILSEPAEKESEVTNEIIESSVRNTLKYKSIIAPTVAEIT